MNILALETSTAALSIALQRGDQRFVRHDIVPREHATLILPWIQALLTDAKMTVADLHKVAVGCGPGGFTSIRVGMGVAQGICLASSTGIPIVLISSLHALAQTVMDQSLVQHVIVAQDAKMGEVYFAAYQKDQDGFAKAVIEDTLAKPTEVPMPGGDDWVLVGDAWSVYPALDSMRNQFSVIDAKYPHASAILHLAKQGVDLPVEKALPSYLRDKTAWKKHTR